MVFFKQLHRYGNQVNTHDLLKAIAMIVMFVDHSGLYLFDNNIWMRIVGRSAAPLFFFVVGTASSFRFKPNLLFYGLLLSIITYLTERLLYINILINFVIIKFIFDNYVPMRSSNRTLILSFLLLLAINFYINPWLEYGSFGLYFAIAGRLISQKDKRGYYWAAFSAMLYFLIESYRFAWMDDPGYEISFGVVVIALGWAMCFYKFRIWPMPEILRYPTLFLSRYSLQLYFLHLAGLKVYSTWAHG